MLTNSLLLLEKFDVVTNSKQIDERCLNSRFNKFKSKLKSRIDLMKEPKIRHHQSNERVLASKNRSKKRFKSPNRHRSLKMKIKPPPTGSGVSFMGAPMAIYDDPPDYSLEAIDLKPKIPIKFADEKENKPIVIVSEVLLPRKKQKIVYHHSRPRNAYLHDMMSNMNPYYMSLLTNNPALKPYTENNPFIKSYLGSPKNKKAVRLITEKLFKKNNRFTRNMKRLI